MQLQQLAVKMIAQRLTRNYFTDATIKPLCTISMCIRRQISEEEVEKEEEKDAVSVSQIEFCRVIAL